MDQNNTSHDNSQPNSFLDKLRSKKAVGPILLVLVLLGVLFTIQQVRKQQEIRKGAFVNGANLTVSASKTNLAIGDEVTLTLSVSSLTYQLTALEAHLKIPADTFQVTNYDDTGSFFSSDFKVPPTQNGDDYNFVLTNSPTSPKSGSGKIAVITLKALKATNGSLNIDWLPATQVTAKSVENQNVIDVASGATLTVAGPTTAGKVNLKFQSTTTQISVGQTFTVDAYMENSNQTVTAAELHLTYPSTALQLTKLEASTLLPTILKDAVIQVGSASISVGSSADNPPTGSGSIAKLTFKALQAQTQPVQVVYATTTKVAGMGSDASIVGTLTPYGVTITSIAQPTSTPTPATVTPGSDTTKPTVQFTSPINNDIYPKPGQTNTGVNVAVTATDASGIAGIKIFNGTKLLKDCNYVTTTCSFFWSYSAEPDGAKTLRAEATDRAVPANVGTTTVTFYKNVAPSGVVTNTPSVPTATPIKNPTPTNTPIQVGTSLLLSLKLPAIGLNTSTENISPLSATRYAMVEFYKNGQFVSGSTTSAVLSFAGGRFVGSTVVSPNLVGSYEVKLSLNNTLVKSLGILNIVQNTQNTAPQATFIPGDLAHNNVLDIFDYNILISCYGARSSSAYCSGRNTQADLNDNGQVDSIDYNVLLTSFRDAVQGD